MVRSLLVGAVVLAALVLAALALAIRVHVRVEGATTTIFGATEPLVTPVVGTITPPDGPAVTVTKPTPFGALERASRRGEFYYRVESFSFGPYVAQIGRYGGTGTTGWVYKVNGVSPPVSSTEYRLRDGDRVLWYFARFGATGGPETLRLVRTASGCYRTIAQDDNGRANGVRDVRFVLDGRRIDSLSGRLCPRGHWHTLRATKRGFVRSQVVTPPRAGTAQCRALACRTV